MSTKKYVSLEKLGVYHGKITGVIADGDAKALSDAKAYIDEKTSGIATNENLGALTERVTTAEGEIAAIKEDVNAFFLDADMTESAKDTLKELQTYIASDETAASQMAASIKENADAIDVLEGTVDGKVDKEEGKGLSTNDFTNDLKTNYDAAYDHSQVTHSPADAQANIIESVKVNGTALEVTDKAIDITVPTDNADLANGAGYLVADDVANKADKGTTLEAYGIADAYTSAQTDTAIDNAIAQFVEVSDEEINNLFA